VAATWLQRPTRRRCEAYSPGRGAIRAMPLPPAAVVSAIVPRVLPLAGPGGQVTLPSGNPWSLWAIVLRDL